MPVSKFDRVVCEMLLYCSADKTDTDVDMRQAKIAQ